VCEEYEAEQRSGSAHVGMSALIDFIAGTGCGQNPICAGFDY